MRLQRIRKKILTDYSASRTLNTQHRKIASAATSACRAKKQAARLNQMRRAA